MCSSADGRTAGTGSFPDARSASSAGRDIRNGGNTPAPEPAAAGRTDAADSYRHPRGTRAAGDSGAHRSRGRRLLNPRARRPRRRRQLLVAGARPLLADAASGNTITAATLAFVESRVGCSHHSVCQLIAVTGDLIECADSKTRRNGSRTRWKYKQLRAHTLAQSFCHSTRLGRCSVGKHDGEFLASEPGNPVPADSQAAVDARDELPQHLIPDLVSMAVVDPLEVIEVAHHDTQGPAQAAGTLDFARELLLEVVPAASARQLIDARQHAVVVQRPLQGGRKIGDAPRNCQMRPEVFAPRIAWHPVVGPRAQSFRLQRITCAAHEDDVGSRARG